MGIFFAKIRFLGWWGNYFWIKNMTPNKNVDENAQNPIFLHQFFESMTVAQNFSDNLFWDVDENDLDQSKNSRFIIARVLTNGKLSDWFALTSLYPFEKIKKEVVQIPYLDKVTLNFCSQLFHVPKSKFKCYNQPPSIQALWQINNSQTPYFCPKF